MAKAAGKKAPTPGETAPTPGETPVQGPGVIVTLVECLKGGGGTVEELYGKLAEVFPDRASAKGGMRTTVAIQLKRLHKTGKCVITAEEVEGRGTV